MHVAVLGAGAAGFAAAAVLEANGHAPVLWSPSGAGTKALAAGEPLVAEGVVSGTFHPRVTHRIGEAIDGAEAVILALPLNGHRAVMDAAAPYLRRDQSVIISAHGSFSALYLSKIMHARGSDVPIIAWATTVTRSRRTGLAAVRIATLRGRVDMAALPGDCSHVALSLCTALFGERFAASSGLLATALGNVNPLGHLALALGNFTRMERGEAWGQMANLTPSIGRLLEAADAERLALAAALGVTVPSLRQHYQRTYGVADAPVSEIAASLAAAGTDTQGPTTIETRYVLEDVPYGLWPTVLLGRAAGLRMTLHEAGIALFSALYGRDFTRENDLIDAIGLDTMTPTSLARLAREGYGTASA